MVFNCGLTAEEAWKRKLKRLESWHSFFALWPRVVNVDERGNQTCAWLQFIERKGTHHEPTPMARLYGFSSWWSWEYRACVSATSGTE